MVALFVLTSFLTALLLFVVQPMVGRMVLPAFGGSPQVWATSMLFFQVALLAGYGYTHLTTTRLSPRSQPWVHLAIAVLPLAALPIALSVTPSGRGGLSPSLELLAALSAGVAAPFVLVATSGPMVQRWFSWTSHRSAGDPYFLFAAGNLGSAAGLLAYPFLLEPTLSIENQSRLWLAGYILALVLLGACAWFVRKGQRAPVNRPEPDRTRSIPRDGSQGVAPKPPLREVGRWLLLAFVPSSLMLAVTTLISTDIAAVPLLWIVPLGTYLLTFTLAFSSWGPRVYRWSRVATPLVAVAALAVRPPGSPVLVSLAIQVLLVFVGGAVCHGMLAQSRPAPSLLTRFYLVLSVGGALGGAFNGLIAPLVFPTVLEYGVTVVLLVGLVVHWREPVARAGSWGLLRRFPVMAMLALLPIAAYMLLGTTTVALPSLARLLVAVLLGIPLLTYLSFSGAIGVGVLLPALLPPLVSLASSELVERTFFGVHRVKLEGSTLQLLHGTTVHGTQDISSPATRKKAVSYYHPEEPFGDVMALVDEEAEIGVLGLGAGGIAAYGRAEHTIVFHEIDPAVVEIASNSFSYLDESDATIETVLGDGRLTLDGVDARYQVLVMDAFTSDAVPVHLLTVEAFETYFDAIEEEGFIAINITNRYIDFRPVLAAAASELNVDGVYSFGDGEPEDAKPSRWVVLARSSEQLEPLRQAGWLELPEQGVLWTDQRSSLFSVLRR